MSLRSRLLIVRRRWSPIALARGRRRDLRRRCARSSSDRVDEQLRRPPTAPIDAGSSERSGRRPSSAPAPRPVRRATRCRRRRRPGADPPAAAGAAVGHRLDPPEARRAATGRSRPAGRSRRSSARPAARVATDYRVARLAARPTAARWSSPSRSTTSTRRSRRLARRSSSSSPASCWSRPALLAWWLVRRRPAAARRRSATTAGAIAAGDLTAAGRARPTTAPRSAGSAPPSTRCSATSRRPSHERRAHRGPAAPVRRRRLPRAAHAAHVDPRLRRAVPPRGAARPARRPRPGHAPASRPRAAGWACSSTTCCCWPGSTRAARSSAQPVDLGALAADAVDDARAVDPDRPVDARRRRPVDGRPATTRGCARSSTTCWPTCGPTRRRARRRRSRVHADGDRAPSSRSPTTGPGMPPTSSRAGVRALLPGRPVARTPDGGAGLGLSIVAAIVAAHGGRVGRDHCAGRWRHVPHPAAAAPLLTPDSGEPHSLVTAGTQVEVVGCTHDVLDAPRLAPDGSRARADTRVLRSRPHRAQHPPARFAPADPPDPQRVGRGPEAGVGRGRPPPPPPSSSSPGAWVGRSAPRSPATTAMAPVRRRRPPRRTRRSSPRVARAPALDVAAVLNAVKGAVVDIQSTGPGFSGQGSGFVYTSDGHVLTNNHVVEGAPRSRVTLHRRPPGTRATVVGTDPTTDLAVLNVDTDGLTAAALGELVGLQVGEDVVAIGNALASSQTVTRGIVSRRRPQPSEPSTLRRPHPDRRRHQPGQLGRPAGQRRRPGGRHQHRHRRRASPEHRLRHPDRRRQDRGRPAGEGHEVLARPLPRRLHDGQRHGHDRCHRRRGHGRQPGGGPASGSAM